MGAWAGERKAKLNSRQNVGIRNCSRSLTVAVPLAPRTDRSSICGTRLPQAKIGVPDESVSKVQELWVCRSPTIGQKPGRQRKRRSPAYGLNPETTQSRHKAARSWVQESKRYRSCCRAAERTTSASKRQEACALRHSSKTLSISSPNSWRNGSGYSNRTRR